MTKKKSDQPKTQPEVETSTWKYKPRSRRRQTRSNPAGSISEQPNINELVPLSVDLSTPKQAAKGN